MSAESDWRKNRKPGWHEDIGYQLQDVLRGHRFEVMTPGSDVGRHACSCGSWEGYWTDFHPHVADHLRAIVVDRFVDTAWEARVMAGQLRAIQLSGLDTGGPGVQAGPTD